MIYSTGILFNQLHDLDSQDEEDDEEDLDYGGQEDEGNINPISMSSSFHPSAMGISFALDDDSRDVKVELSYGKYTTIKDLKDGHKHVRVRAPTVENDYRDNLTLQTFFNYSEDDYLELKKPLNKDDRSKLLESVAEDRTDLKEAIWSSYDRFSYGWIRKAHHHTYTMNTKNRSSEEVEDGLRLILNVKQDIKSNSRICTLSAVNEQKDSSVNSKMCYFQVSLRVGTTAKQGFLDIRPAIETKSKDMEERSLDLLYRDYGVYSSGHGISTHWDIPTKSGVVKEIQTTTMPKHKVPLVDFNKIPNNKNINLSIAGFAYKSPEHCFKNLRGLAEEYSSWIRSLTKKQAELDKHFQETAKMHIEACQESHNRIIKGIELLEKNATTFKVFQDANKSMVMQRKHRDIQSEKKDPKDEYVAPTDYKSESYSWRPFQIAFILMNIESMSNSESEERDIVDLIWFPTGGGKTEAYLGLTAFTVFYRRLTNQEKYGGTTVIMRYTLRLLTSQQFDRACTLICACELLRQQDTESYGEEKITIGLWVGRAASPNTVDDAKKGLDSMRKSSEANNPFHVLGCPWCGTSTNDRDNMGYRMLTGPKRLLIHCPNKRCHFSYNQTASGNIGGLPILVVDEDIYKTPPTLLFGTVDKFAMLPWRKESSSIFALNKENANLSPSLIIQDELHLISGPLGSIVGMYETAIDMLCSAKGIKPKIVASTATIRRAHEQCQALYARDTNLFPSPGLNASDSFFSRESKEPGGRLYVGVMPSGKTSASVRSQLIANIFQAPELMETDSLQLKDTYWTNVIYHNSIKDLGVSRSIIDDTFESHCKRLAKINPRKRRYLSSTYKKVRELTSRTKTVSEVLQALEEPYKQEQKKDNSINILLTTNMISVGIDIDRLGIMTIINQPKMTSEYIQASSRVGRRDPGIVFTAYNPVRSRDRSLYEQFQKYHQSLYRYVEPSSVTPFSAGAINRALHGMLITLIRHKMQLHDDELLAQFKSDSAKFTSIVHEVLGRARNSTRNSQVGISAEPEEVKEGINDFIDRINGIVKSGKSIAYSHKREGSKRLMQDPDSKEGGAEFVVYRSMRDTDLECYITIENEYYE